MTVNQPKPAFSCHIPMRWGDLDAFGHVNNTLYLRYFEEARFLWMRDRGVPIGGEDFPVVVTIGCTFLRQLFYPDTLRIDCFLSEQGRSSFMIHYKLYSESDLQNPACEGYSKVVWVAAATGKSTPLPDNVKSWF